MEQDKNIDSRDSYIEIQGDEKQLAQFEIITKPISLLKPPVKLTKKNLKKYLKEHFDNIFS